MPKKIDDILIPGQNVNKLNLRKYLGSREVVTPQDYGAFGDGIVDDTEDGLEAGADPGANDPETQKMLDQPTD